MPCLYRNQNFCNQFGGYKLRLVVQRVRGCTVIVDNSIVGSIDYGLLAYLGIKKGDTDKDLNYLVNKLLGLRIFKDKEGVMNLSVTDISGSVMIISQFTLCADTRKGNRPSYNNAENPEIAKKYYLNFIKKLQETNLKISSGKFQADMDVSYTNDGPVTILIDSEKKF